MLHFAILTILPLIAEVRQIPRCLVTSDLICYHLWHVSSQLTAAHWERTQWSNQISNYNAPPCPPAQAKRHQSVWSLYSQFKKTDESLAWFKDVSTAIRTRCSDIIAGQGMKPIRPMIWIHSWMGSLICFCATYLNLSPPYARGLGWEMVDGPEQNVVYTEITITIAPPEKKKKKTQMILKLNQKDSPWSISWLLNLSTFWNVSTLSEDWRVP